MLGLKPFQPDRLAQSVACLTQRARGPGFDTWSGHILPFLFLLIQEWQLSVSGEKSMCTKYWRSNPAQEKCGKVN